MLTHRFWSVEHRFDDVAGGWADGGAATAGEAGDPEDVGVGHEDRDGGALLAGDLGVDEDVLELPRAAVQEVDAVAGAGRANGECSGQDLGVEEGMAAVGRSFLVRLPGAWPGGRNAPGAGGMHDGLAGRDRAGPRSRRGLAARAADEDVSLADDARSEERRVGKGWRARGGAR